MHEHSGILQRCGRSRSAAVGCGRSAAGDSRAAAWVCTATGERGGGLRRLVSAAKQLLLPQPLVGHLRVPPARRRVR